MLWAASAALAQDRIELRLAHGFSAAHGLHTEFLQPWARELEQRAGVRVVVHDGKSALGAAQGMLERLIDGKVDIVHATQSDYHGTFPRTGILEIPFVATRSDVATQALWTLRGKELKREYEGLKVLALHAHSGGVIHTVDKRVATLADLKGLRLRSPASATSRILSAMGATALGMPEQQIFANLKAGLIDGVLASWDEARGQRVLEGARHHVDAGLFTQPYLFAMTQKRFDTLPTAVRKAIDDLSGDALQARFGPWWDRWDQAAMEAARTRGGTVAVLSAKERAAWMAKAAPAIERYLAELQKIGVNDARTVYAEMKKLNKTVTKPPS